ncbi:MAG: WD40 repeat domain-containing protein [Chloroflexi bacterium]|nr:WD40 repeat domain-containing protein [Chloroflexota bacterium]
MKRTISFAIILIISFLTACQPAVQTASPAVEQTAAVTDTAPALATETSLPTPRPSLTNTATEPPTPTETIMPTLPPTSTPPVISSESVGHLAYTGRLGGGALVAVALAPDAAQVVVLTSAALMAYDVSTGSLSWEVPTDHVYNKAVYSDDGTQIITSTRGGTVRHWDAGSGKVMGEALPIVNNTRAVALSSNGTLLAALDNFDQTFVWDTTTGEKLQTNNGLAFPFGAMQVAVSSDGKTFLNSGIDSKVNYQIRLWDVTRGRFLTGLQGLPGEVFDLDFSPDGQYVAALATRVSGGLRGMQYLYLWRVSDGALLDTVDLSLDTSTYAFLENGSTILAGTASGQVMFINFRFGDRYTYGFLQDQIAAHPAAVVSLSSSADGLKYASAAADGSVKVWDAATGEVLFSTQVENLSLQNIHDEWVYEDLKVINHQHESGFSASPTSAIIARTASDLRSIDIIDLLTGEIIRNLKIETAVYFNSPVFSPDGKTVAAVLDNTRIIVWEVDSGVEVLRLSTQHIKPITKLQYSPDGNWIASMSDGELFVWDLGTVSQKHALTAFNTFSYSPDGHSMVTDVQDMGINLLDAKTGRKVTYIETGYVNDLAISPDSKYAAVAGYRSQVRYEQDNLVYFIDLEQQKRIRTLEITGYPAEVMDVVYTPDGSAIVTIDLYGDVYIWGASTGALLQHYEGQVAMPAQTGFTSDGRTLLILGADNSIQMFQVTE